MLDIREVMKNTPSLVDFINENREERMDESLKDILNALKRKFKQVTEYLFGWVAKVSNKLSYWLPVNDKGEVQPAISPLTAGQAYTDGMINKESTLVYLAGRKGQALTGCKTKPADAEKLYGSGNSLDYWKRFFKESVENNEKPIVECNNKEVLEWYAQINEVKMHTDDPQAKYNIVDTPELQKVIAAHLKNTRLPRLLIMGAPGIGKTAILRDVLNTLPGFKEHNLIVKTLSNETPENFALPTYVYDDAGAAVAATDVPKTWMPVYKPTGDRDKDQMLDDACGKGLLFIDELSRAQPQVLNVILPLINEGIFNGYKMGSGWTIIAASNRAEDETSGQANLGNALANRFNVVYYEPTYKSWENWAKTQNYISPLLLSWLSMPEHENMSGGKYFYWDPNEANDTDDPSLIFCTPRAWTNAMSILCEYANTADLEGFKLLDIPTSIIGMALNGTIPREAVDSFLAFLDVIRSVGNFDDAVYAIWQKGGAGFNIDKKNLNKVALALAQLIITAHADNLPTEEEFVNMAEWLVSTGSDQMASYVLDIMQNVFAGMLPKEQKSAIFVLRRKYESIKNDATKLRLYERAFSAFLDKYGLTLDTMPDWKPGLDKLAKKFGGVFSQYKFDGKDALG